MVYHDDHVAETFFLLKIAWFFGLSGTAFDSPNFLLGLNPSPLSCLRLPDFLSLLKSRSWSVCRLLVFFLFRGWGSSRFSKRFPDSWNFFSGNLPCFTTALAEFLIPVVEFFVKRPFFFVKRITLTTGASGLFLNGFSSRLKCLLPPDLRALFAKSFVFAEGAFWFIIALFEPAPSRLRGQSCRSLKLVFIEFSHGANLHYLTHARKASGRCFTVWLLLFLKQQ